MRTIITTVGTSLLSNRDDRPWADWRFGGEHPDKDAVSAWLKTADPARASAEIHTWKRLGILEEPAGEKVVLIHSHTPDGKFCAQCIDDFVRWKGLETEIKQIAELSYADAATFNRGLSRLVRVLAETLRAGRASGEVAIAATGGFKAEIAVANLVGALLGSPVYYIYEQFEQLVTLEPIPISLEPQWLREGSGKALLGKLGDGVVTRREIDSLLKTDGRLEILLESEECDGDEIICTNVLGELAVQLLKTPHADWPPTCDLDPEKKIKLQGARHHRPEGWEETVNRLSRNRFVRMVRYDGSAGNRKGIRPASDNSSDIHVVMNDGKFVMGLRVETTSGNAEQRRLLIDDFRRLLKL